MASISKRASGAWQNTSYGIRGTATDTITTLPTTIYSDGTNATVSIKGNTTQSGTPTPDSPIMPEGCDNKTANLFDKSMADLYNHSTLGQTNTWAYSVESTGTTLRIPCEANTQYTLSIGSTIANTIFRISETSTDDVPIEGGYGGIVCHTILNGGAINSHTFTTASDTKYILFQVNLNVMTVALNTLMLNIGSTALPYEPFGVKIPISLADTTTNNYLGEVETTRKIKKLVLDGTETITEESTNVYSIPITDTVTTGTGLSTHFEYDSTASAGQFRIEAGKAVFGYNDTLANFSTFLAAQYAAGTPVTVWYILATPTTGIVNEPLMRIGDYADEVSGVSIPTTDGANMLSVDTTVQPSEVSINYHGWHMGTVHEHTSGQWD